MKTTRIAIAGVLTAVLVLGPSVRGHADDAAAPHLTTTGSIRDALIALGTGRDVELVLANGKSYRGKLGSVGKETVIISQIAGREFSDVLITLDEVAAVELRVRGN